MMEHIPDGGEWMVASLWGNELFKGLRLFPLFPVPLLIPVFPVLVTLPISPIPLHGPYFPELLPRLNIFNTLLGATCSSPIRGLVIIFCLMY